MPVARPSAIVPTFGDWEAENDDVSYTLLFEKIRATKNESNPLKSKELHKSSKGMVNNKHPESGKKIHSSYDIKKTLYSSQATKFEHCKQMTLEDNINRRKPYDLHMRRRPSLEQIPDLISQNSLDSDSHPQLLHRSSSIGNSSLSRRHNDKFSRENYNCKDKHFSHSSNMSSCNYSNANIVHQVHKGRLRAGNFSSTSLAARNGKIYCAASPDCTPNYKLQQGSLQSRSINSSMMTSTNGALPTFGNWDEIDPDKVEFTVLFDKARNEKENSSSSSSISKLGFNKHRVAATIDVDDGDLYKPKAHTHKRHNGFWSLLCCSKV